MEGLYLGILCLVTAVLCAIGFYKFVYFLSIGYGLAIAGVGVALLCIFHNRLEAVTIIWCLLLILYGMRLAGFLIYREAKNAVYRKTLKTLTKSEETMPIFVKFIIWVSVSILYVAQISPVFYQMYHSHSNTVLPIVGVVISTIGLLMEALADYQKSAQKKTNPQMVATKGLYRLVRCPNYFGEILFWSGVFIGGIDALKTVGPWMLATAGYLCIVAIMFNGAKRLEKRQNERYGKLDAYTSYANHTPIILPFLPLYHLVKEDQK